MSERREVDSATQEWQALQRASYESSAPTTIVSPSAGAGRPSTSRCVIVAGPPQRWQTACSLSTSSARQSSSGIEPNGRPRKSWSSPDDDDARSALDEHVDDEHDPRREELHLVDPDHVVGLGEARDVLRPRHRDGAHLRACVADDVADVVAVVDARLHDQRALAGDLGAAQPADQLLALAAEHRAADDLEPAAALWEQPDHGRDPSRAVRRTPSSGRRPSGRGAGG